MNLILRAVNAYYNKYIGIASLAIDYVLKVHICQYWSILISFVLLYASKFRSIIIFTSNTQVLKAGSSAMKKPRKDSSNGVFLWLNLKSYSLTFVAKIDKIPG